MDNIQRLLGDQSVGVERLEDTKKGFNAAWEMLDTTYVGLVGMHTKDKTQVADMEEKDEEHNNLRARVLNLLGSLTDAIAQRNQGQNGHQLHQERLAEAQ